MHLSLDQWPSSPERRRCNVEGEKKSREFFCMDKSRLSSVLDLGSPDASEAVPSGICRKALAGRWAYSNTNARERQVVIVKYAIKKGCYSNCFQRIIPEGPFGQFYLVHTRAGRYLTLFGT